MSRTRILFIVLCAATLIQNLAAQDIRNTQNSVDYGKRSSLTVDPITQALQLEIPLGAYRQRGGTLPVSLNYSSKVWRIGNQQRSYCTPGRHVDTDTNDLFLASYAEESKAGWTASIGFPYIASSHETYNNNGQPATAHTKKVGRLTLVMPDGSRHELRKSDQVYEYWETISGKYYATDGSRLVYDRDTDVLYLPDGSRFEGVGESGFQTSGAWTTGVYRDANGNVTQYNTNSLTDNLGRTINKPLTSSLLAGEAPNAVADDVEYSLPGIGSGTLDYEMRWRKLSDEGVISEHESSQTIKYKGDWYTAFCGDIPDGSQALFHSNVTVQGHDQMYRGLSIFDPVVLHEIELPNGHVYTFKYNIYGEITKIVYPTGAYERFEYAEVQGISGWFDQGISSQANRGVTKRWISHDGTSQSEVLTEYEAVYNPTVGEGTRRVTNPDGTKSEFIYFEKPDERLAWGFDNPLYGKTKEVRQYSSTGTLMGRKLTEWTTDGSIVAGPVSGTTAYKTRNARGAREISIAFEPNESSALATMSETVYDSHSDAEYFATLNATQAKKYNYVVVTASTASTATLATATGWFSSASPAVVTETDYLYDANYKARNITSLPIETRVEDTSGNVKAKSQIVYDSESLLTDVSSTRWQNPNTNYRGLVTSTKSWSDIAANQFVETRAQYDQLGNLRNAWDARNNLTQTSYSSTYDHAYPTSVTTPIPDPSGVNGSNTAFTSGAVYDFNTGLPTSTTDINSQTTTVEYNDALLRPTKVIAPNGQQKITEYGAGTTEATRFVKVRSQIDEANWKEGYSWFDGLGRTIKTQSVDTSGDVFVETEYDNMGRAKKATNPYRANEAKLWTENTFDTAGRPWKVTTPDNAVVETTYGLATTGSQIGTTVTVKDQALKERRSVTNALGQLKRVDEPTTAGLGSIDNPNQYTSYVYDTLNNLTTVSQGVQTRTFSYNSLSRLTSAANPESGTINYGYDPNGNLTSKVDARNITTSYSYDALNRVTNRAYTNEPSGSDTPDVSYTYDNVTNAKGKLTKVSSSVSTTEYVAFDILGRVTRSKQITDGVTYGDDANPMTYSYNLAGALIEQKYPSGRVVKNVLENDGDLSMVQSKKTASSGFFNYAKHFTYAASGAVTGMQLGNNRWESTVFNSRLQPTQIALGTTQGTTDKLKLNYDYGTTANNGNVQSQTITVPGMAYPLVQTYAYDSLNRLDDSNETSNGTQTWRQDFTYDRYGNRNFNQTNTTMPASFANPAVTNPTISTANNRITSTGYTYDSSGNTTFDAALRKFTYDAENKQVKVESTNSSQTVTGTVGEYFYDGDGKRVKKKAYISGVLSEETIFVYDAAGKSIAEYSTVVANSTDAKVAYLTSDHLGSPRVSTDANGAVIARHDYHPFGEEIATSQRTIGLNYAADTVRKKFTGYERDTESNLNYAQNRYHSGNLGRFTSPDPYKIVAEVQEETDPDKAEAKLKAYLSKPQQWNQYAYVVNNPLRYVDPTGEVIVLTGTDAEVQAKLKRLNDFLGDERFNLIKKSSDGRILFLNDKDICGGNFSKFANVGNTAETKEFSRKFAEILAAPEQVRFNIGVETMFKPQSGDVTRRGLATVLDIRQRGGGVTLSAQESMSGFIEVWVASNAAQAGNSLAATRNTSSLTEDGSQLRFPDNTVVDAHEFGHVYDLLNGLPDGTSSVGFENAARANRPGNQRRKSEH